MGKRNDGLGDLVRGALAGLAATWVMSQVTTVLYERENEAARKKEDDARGGKSAYGVAAEKGAGLLGIELSDEQRATAGSAVHWVLGAGAGAAYAAMRGRVPYADAGGGLLYGAVFFLAVDELGNTALGLTPGPQAFPWEAHARGLAGHLAFGAATEFSIRALERISG
jgi:hypothetical protein